MLIPNLLVVLGSLSVGNLFNSQGDTKASFRIGVVSSAVSIVISPVLVWIWGVFGLLLSVIFTALVGSVLGLHILREKYGFFPDVQYALRLVVCSSISAAVVYVVLRFVPLHVPVLSLFVGGFMFLVSCMFLAPLLGVLNESDVLNLYSMVSGIRVVSIFANPLLEVEKRMISLLRSREKEKMTIN
jgi:peptidoglycan biosynthesis protein MviN/MurJ (putative lipid II flippase)